MRIVFVNLHTNEFLVKTASKFVFKQAVAMKHKYFLDYLINNTNLEVCSYVNKRGTSLASNLPSFLMKILILFRYIESRWVLRKNGLKNKITILKNVKEIKPDDIVFLYQLYIEKSPEIKDVGAFKVVSLLHFFGTQTNSNAIREMSPNMIVCEGDLKKHSEIFRKYYNWCEQSIFVHSFVAAERFCKIKPYKERINRVFSTGTITYKTHKEFLEVYGDSCDQPMRKYVKTNKELLSGYIDCYNSDFSENAKTTHTHSNRRINHLLHAAYYKLFASQQKSYFSFNMVEKFNDYKMFLIGEEVLGIPGIGFVEGMSCGCTYIGQRGYYEDYGMEEGVHFIGYDGTPEDLLEKVRYYQQPEQQEILSQIAENGYQFAKNNFRGEIVAKRMLDAIIKRQKEESL